MPLPLRFDRLLVSGWRPNEMTQTRSATVRKFALVSQGVRKRQGEVRDLRIEVTLLVSVRIV